MVVNGVEVVFDENENVECGEIEAYVARGLEKYGNKLERIKLAFDGENVEITYNFTAVPFERIRRITGYLVGTLDRWNDAKRQEENDRVKHSI